jgi:hypothetical protein
VDAVIDLARLLDLPGASELQETWLAALARQPGYLDGNDAETAACDALVTPVVTGHPDLAVVDQMIDIIVAFRDAAGDDGTADRAGSAGAPGDDPGDYGTAGQDSEGTAGSPAAGGPAPLSPQAQQLSPRAQQLSPQAQQALRCAIARLAVDLVAGPDRLASILRRGLLDAPYTSKSVILDVGVSAAIPGAIRRAVQLRARHCEWPGCSKPLAWCDIHHLRHKSDGGPTSVTDCVALCQFHHDVCIHRHGWRLVLHPDATTTAYGPAGQILGSHGPPASPGLPGSTGPPATPARRLRATGLTVASPA